MPTPTQKPIEQTAPSPSPAPSPPSPKAIISSVTWGRERKRSNKQYTSDLERAEVTMLVPEGVTVAKAIEEAKGLVEFMLGPEPEPEHPAPPPREEPPSRGPPPTRGGYEDRGSYPPRDGYGTRGGSSGGSGRPKLCRDECGTEIVWNPRIGERGAFVNAHDTERYGREGDAHRCRSGARR